MEPARQRKAATTLHPESALDRHTALSAPSPFPAGLPLRALACVSVASASDGALAPLTPGAFAPAAARLHATGLAVAPAATAKDVRAAVAAARGPRVLLARVRGAVVDLSSPAPTLWLVTRRAWYRVLSPAPEWGPHFAESVACVRSAAAVADAAAAEAGGGGADAAADLAALAAPAPPAPPSSSDGDADPYDVLPDAVAAVEAGGRPHPADLRPLAPLLACVAAAAAGGPCPTLASMADLAGVDVGAVLAAWRQGGRPRLRRGGGGGGGCAAAPRAPRPPPTAALPAPAPGVDAGPILAAWDLAHSLAPEGALAGGGCAATVTPLPFPAARALAAFAPADGPDYLRHAPGPSAQAWALADLHATLLAAAADADAAAADPAAAAVPAGAVGALRVAAWPHLARAALGGKPGLSDDAAAALAALATTPYGDLPPAPRAALLAAALAAAADGDAVGKAAGAASARAPRGPAGATGFLGAAADGTRLHALGGAAGAGAVFAESAAGDAWSLYEGADLTALAAWLAAGDDDGEAAAADAIATHVASRGAAPPVDPYAALPPAPTPADALRAALGELLARARWWEKPPPWLQARQAARAGLAAAGDDARALARLLWLVEEIVYDDLLKGTGWGRRRHWFRERLAKCDTVADAAALAAAAAGAARSRDALALLTPAQFWECAGAGERAALPAVGDVVAVVRAAYTDHLLAAAPPPEFAPPPLPPHWRAAERCVVDEVAFSAGVWQRPTWQGRLPAAGALPEDASAGRAVAWLLLRRDAAGAWGGGAAGVEGGLPRDGDARGAAEIDWTPHSFAYGFAGPPPTPDDRPIHVGDDLRHPEPVLPPFWTGAPDRDVAAAGVHVVADAPPGPAFWVPEATFLASVARPLHPGDAVVSAGGPAHPPRGARGVVVSLACPPLDPVALAAPDAPDPWRCVRVAWEGSGGSDGRGGGGGGAGRGARRDVAPWALALPDAKREGDGLLDAPDAKRHAAEAAW